MLRCIRLRETTMGLFFRKSLGLGPLRVNASNKGLGFSAGIKGARFGVDARGRAYVHCGHSGIYYRSFLGGNSQTFPPEHRSKYPRTNDPSIGEQREIESGDVSEMVPESAEGLLAELRRRRCYFPWHILYSAIMGVGTATAFLAEFTLLGISLGCAALAGFVVLLAWSRFRRVFRIDYDLDDEYAKQYGALHAAFSRFQRSQRIWLVESEADVYNRKYYAGANKSIRRTLVRFSFSLPPGLKSNITPPMIPAGRQQLYLLPDRVLVCEGRNIGAIEYHELRLVASTTHFIEEDAPPSDAQQVDSTWRYVNKKGGPDRRFNNNRQLPIMRYGELRWASDSGLNELHQVSAAEIAAAFARAVENLTHSTSHSPKVESGIHRRQHS